MSKRPKIGDIVEIPLPNNGFGYAQFTHKHKMYGALLRVFDEQKKIECLEDFAKKGHLFTTFFPLGAAINKGVVIIVGNIPIKSEFHKFPVFKTGVPDKKGKIQTWWLWDGEKEDRIGSLNEKQLKYPMRGIINDTLLIERICEGWQG